MAKERGRLQLFVGAEVFQEHAVGQDEDEYDGEGLAYPCGEHFSAVMMGHCGDVGGSKEHIKEHS